MITVCQIRDGRAYLGAHLRANDYHSEGETIAGHWHGRGAARLGLAGEVTEEQFQALRANLHPSTGEKLTPRSRVVAFHDIVISAPKSYSVMAMVGGDERLVAAFQETAERILGELERVAAVRVRKGDRAGTEEHRLTGNAVCAVFHHDTSRLLDPQLHAHLVFANLSYDADRPGWLALQPRPMMEESRRIRRLLHHELAERAEALGHPVEWEGESFRLKAVSREVEDRFSQRSVQREGFRRRYRKLFGREADKGRVESFIKEGRSAATSRFRGEFLEEFGREPTGEESRSFVRDWRSSKLRTSSRERVREIQGKRLSPEERSHLRDQVGEARGRSQKEPAPGERLEARREGAPEEITSQARKERSTGEAPRPSKREVEQRRKVAERRARRRSRSASSRQEIYRRIRRGMEIASVLRGRPGAALARQVRDAARRAR